MIIYRTWNHWWFRILSAIVGLIDYTIWTITLGWIHPNLEEELAYWYVHKRGN